MAYRADIEIAVRGARQLKELQNQITRTSDSVSLLDGALRSVGNLLPRSFNNLNSVLADAAKNFNQVALGTNEAVDAARDYYQASKNLNNALRERVKLLDDIKQAEAGTVLSNIAASKASRVSSGFKAFSAGIEGTTAVEKSIRRNRERVARQPKAPIESYLALPSSEMLQASQRGIQQLSAYYGDINTEIDTGVQKGRAFTTQLVQSAEAASTLPPIFGQVQQALQGIVRSTAAGNTVQTSWAQVLAEFPRIQSDILRSQLAEIKINKESLSVDYARLEARKRLQRIAAFEQTQTARTQRTQQLNESLALGVGFPLLFGGGVGSVAGSFAGSFAGKGFGGQIIGGALGQTAENVVRSIAKITSSLDSMVAAAGIAGTATERHIEALKKAGKEEEALAVATAALANVVGQDGVRALKDFENAGTSLANTLSQLATQLAAKAAQALGGPAGGIVGALEESALFGQAQSSKDAQQIANFAKLTKTYGQEYYDTLNLIYQRQREINAEAEKNLASTQEVAAIRQVDKNLLDAEIALAKTSGDITNNTVFALKEKVIQQRTYVALQDAVEKGLETESILLQEQLDLQLLRRDREEAIARAAEQSRRDIEAAAKAQLSIKKELYDIEVAVATQLIKREEFTKGETAGLNKQIGFYETLLSYKFQSLAVERQVALQEAAKNGTVDQTNKLFERRKQLLEDELLLQRQQAAARTLEIQLERSASVQAATKPVTDFIQQQEMQNALSKEYNRLLMEGVLPAEAQRLINFGQLVKQQVNEYENQIKALEVQIAIAESSTIEAEAKGAIVTKLQEELGLLKEKAKLVKQVGAQGAGAGPTDYERAQSALAQLKSELNELTDPINMAISGAYSIGDAFGTAMRNTVSALTTGTQTIQQVFADFLNTMAEALLNSAARMIATYVAIGIARQFAGLGSKGGGVESNAQFMERTGNLDLAGNVQMPAFAEGGYPPVGQASLVGENGPELFVPGRQGLVVPNDIFAATRAALNKGTTSSPDAFAENAQALAVSSSYSRERVLERDRQTMLTGAGGSMVIQTQVINNVEYATVDQVAQAAATSAKQARAQVIADMRNKPSTRASLGLR